MDYLRFYSQAIANMKNCTKCNILKSKVEFGKHSQAADGLMPRCRSCRSADAKKIYEVDREQELIRCRNYYKNNKEAVYARHKKYEADRKRTDIMFKITKNLRSRTSMAIKYSKPGSAIKDLGCTVAELKIHLESKFANSMNWDNYGEWHIDHIKPLSKFDLSNAVEFKKACSFNNLQPLWAMDNLRKSNG